MGILPSSFFDTAETQVDPRTVPEVTMLSDGMMIRIGAVPDDLCRIEDLGIGDPIWDIASGRLVDVETMACTTLGADQLADMGLCATPVATTRGTGWFALASSRLINRAAQPAALSGTSRVFFRLWPETRVVAEVEGRPVLLRG